MYSENKPTRPVHTAMEATRAQSSSRAQSSADTVSSGEQQAMAMLGLGHMRSSKPILPAGDKSTLSIQGKGDAIQSPSPAPWSSKR